MKHYTIDITTHRGWEPCDGPSGQREGWYRPKGTGARVCAKSTDVYYGALIYGGDIYGGDIYGGTIRGGTIYGGTIRGGTIYGGFIHGGTIHGGTIRGGNIEGGDIYGGTIRGGDIWRGTIHGGSIEGGIIEGGTINDGFILGGTIWRGTINGGMPPYATAIHWEANVSSPGHVTVGLITHTVDDWLREDEDSPVLWSEFCKDSERPIVVGVVRMLDTQMQAGVCDWTDDDDDDDDDDENT